MEHQFHRGIHRPNAQRLSISLAPLVAQRSLLFRVKADLATKANYGELTPTEESPGLFLLSSSTNKASPSARIISAALSALSPSSVYSQDSWKGDKSPFGAILVPPPQLQSQQYLNVHVDTRRHAIALSPSVQWEDLLENEEDGKEVSAVALNTPLPQSPTLPENELSAPDNGVTEATRSYPSPTTGAPVMPMPKIITDIPVIKLEDLSSGPAVGKLQKKKRSPSEDMSDKAGKRVSKHAKALGRVMGHLSIQPSKRDLVAAKKRRNTTPVVAVDRALQDFKLPELKPGTMASPIRLSFISKSGSEPPVIPGLAEPAAAPYQPHYVKVSQTRQTLPANPRSPPQLAKVRRTMPVPPSPPLPRRSSTPPPPSTPVPTAGKKGHRRYKSSPAVAEFDFHVKRKDWEREDVPPLPAMPPLATMNFSMPRPRARSVATHTSPLSVPIVRAIDPPFPAYTLHQPRQGLVM